LKNLTVSMKIWVFPEKCTDFRTEFSWRNIDRQLVEALSDLRHSLPTRASDIVSDSVRHSCSSARCVIGSVSTCLPRGNLVDGLPRAPSAMRFFQKYFDKNRDCSASVVRSALKPSQVGFDMYRFGWCAREVQENSVARDCLRARF